MIDLAQAFRGRNVLVTGGLGFVGSNLARRLAEYGSQVTIVDCLMPDYGGNPFNISGVEGEVQVDRSDIRDTPAVTRLATGKDCIFSLAAQTSHVESMRDPETDLDINCKAQLSLLEICRHHNPGARIVFASTRQVYGSPDYLPVDEKHMLRPVDVNGINKIAAESYHNLYHSVYGLRTSVLRLTNTYGPRMRVKDARQTFIGVWIRQAVEGRNFEVWGGDQLRDFTFVDDAVDAFLLAAANEESCGKVFNIGGAEPIALRALAGLLVDVNGAGAFDVRDYPEERKRIEIGDIYSDCGLIESALGWRPRVSLREGLALTLEYYRQHLARYV